MLRFTFERRSFRVTFFIMTVATLAALFIIFPVVLIGVLHFYGHARSRSYEQRRLEDEAQAQALSAWQAKETQRRRAQEPAGYTPDKPSVQ